MKKSIIISLVTISVLSLCLFSFVSKNENKSDRIEWITFEEAILKNEQNPKPIIVDVYTDWCKWCKVMDQKTFTNPEVINVINQNYYAVKLNAEEQEDITFKGKTFSFLKNGNKGIHELAYLLLDRQQSYPSTIFLDHNMNPSNIVRGYKDAATFLSIIDVEL